MRALLLTLCVLTACERGRPSEARRLPPPPAPEDEIEDEIEVERDAPADLVLGPAFDDESAPGVPDAALLLTDPALLAELEAHGLALHRVLGAADRSAASLHAASALYRDFVALVSLDDSVARERDPSARAALSATHRLFDVRWLKSARAHFELIGVVNRADRRFATGQASCGELRLVYRLAYAAPRVASRLPLTLSFVYAQGGGEGAQPCRALALRWLALEQVDRAALAAAALAGPLRDVGPAALRRVETNFQSGRWPSAVRPTLGGHAEYVLRSFRAQGGRLELSTLENTPTQKLAASGRAALKRWIAEHFAAIDRGTALLPEPYLAERSVSVQPHGAARLASRAFTQIASGLSAASLPEGAFERAALVRSEAGLMRRLDQLTCKGCHAARSLAGFHLLGEDPADTTPFNAVAVGLSPHLLAELPWRRAFLEALARGELGDEPAGAARPFADRGMGDGRLGDACGLGDPSFASWTCADGLTCVDRLGDVVGTCGPAQGAALGDAVERGALTQERTGQRDRVRVREVEPCLPLRGGAPAKAARSGQGFPLGMCHAPCAAFGQRDGDAICGPLPFGRGTEFDGFTQCLTLHDQPFDRCLADDAHPTWLKRCDRETPCRDGYLCARIPNAGVRDGACVPPYFLFQVRVDGHFIERH